MEEKKDQGNSDFMKETIKHRPLNRRKLVRRTIVTALMAVVFGLVACFTFLLLEPVINKKLYPEEEPQTVVLVDEPEDEILPEDMFEDDSQMEPSPSPPVVEDEQIAEVLSGMELDLGADEYISLLAGVREVAEEVWASIVTVVGVTSDVGWLDNEYESEGAVSGVVVADNGMELLILANTNSITKAKSLKVAFSDGEEYEATLKKKDGNTGLAVISIDKSLIKDSTLETAKAVTLGTSVSDLAGHPVIALGRPMGTEGSICYGNVTSLDNVIRLPDSDYRYMTTDIYGSSNASGVIINLHGQVVGLIDMSYNPSDMKNLVSAVGITELKKVVESLSNDKDIAYFGVYGVDVTQEANQELGVPLGAYITEIDMDSPAMDAGIQSGDVITALGETEVSDYRSLVNALLLEEPGKELTIGLMRQGPEGYTEMELNAVLGVKQE